jgi:hypothetical protein
LNDVARRFDDMDRKARLIDAVGGCETTAQLMRLRQSERTAAAADLERWKADFWNRRDGVTSCDTKSWRGLK